MSNTLFVYGQTWRPSKLTKPKRSKDFILGKVGSRTLWHENQADQPILGFQGGSCVADHRNIRYSILQP